MDYIQTIRKKVGKEQIILNFAGVCVVNSKGRILLQKRGDRNQWGFPGGALELGESVEACAKREVFEETGIEVSIDHLVGVYSKYFDVYPNGDQAQTVLHFFKGHPIGGELDVDGEETLALKYMHPNEVPSLFNQQHQDCFQDFIDGRVGVYR
ncbi:NUDIX domain-containing protein [Alkalihalobacillus sp. LMS6]|uniref:NUDIX hydrolase n=1 Tax=Alkalihalobacillus sp. LMS6 TaxID=2924034 RepID=UPI0020D16117|nr:NUDIX domain-containing protein [Alkalihalobacillus sp. LMS6]UTR07590.1 NUDIX domain-containing protein [Alkalihalobacillus sp. LMS6]